MSRENNVGKWDGWYKDFNGSSQGSSYKYGDTETYKIGSDFLSDCLTVEDWGVGGGGFLRFLPTAIGVDGSDTPFASKKNIDLCTYTSDVEGIHMRHVLEHNYGWEKILDNLLRSASKKICLTFFINLSDDDTKELAHNLKHGVDVPDLSISKVKFDNILSKYKVKSVEIINLKTDTSYKNEIVYKITK